MPQVLPVLCTDCWVLVGVLIRHSGLAEGRAQCTHHSHCLLSPFLTQLSAHLPVIRQPHMMWLVASGGRLCHRHD